MNSYIQEPQLEDDKRLNRRKVKIPMNY